jgi:hypothetical protein
MDQKTEDTIVSTLIKFVSSLFSKDGPKVEVEIPLSAPKETPVEAPKPVVTPAQKFVLTHTRFCADGIFGKLERADGTFVCYTLEHSYDNKPKLADGTYTCKRGPHRLHGMTEDFITFEIMGLPDFNGVPVTGVLFHWGNYNKDSEGCVLMGSSETPTMIGNSRAEWAAFMASLEGVDTFQLEVVSQSQ